ncbi:DUF421 domain-containing protein [Pullulanibacillus camelliae]|uniref:DUF421 domain-containing protein n=1 Tax=Pullulanibacillus camelliae TaxID=1707096 RepID=A0A8J2YHF2_9BACL|nr:DUF421 domain-containing protein [Pullulanibacillus camelliae]GGE42844.1 DUF421 domain-containing protein [Pullulanibacillus camelliae]
MITVVLRTLILYVIILLTFRLMGKREIGQLSVVDFVVSIMIAELAVLSIEEPNRSLVSTVIPIGILFFIQFALALIALKTPFLRHIFDGKPTTIIKEGKIDQKQMRKQRYNYDDLMMQLREKNVRDIADVEFAILEPNGKLSVLQKMNEDEARNQRMAYSFLPVTLILNGIVQEKALEQLHKTPLWLRQKLRELGYRQVKDIACCILDKNKVFHIKLIKE